jgi:hypothetical protein
VTLLGLLVGCNAVLGLEDAHVDSSIGKAGSGEAGSAGTAGGGNAGSDSSAGAGGAPADSLCERYCQAVTKGCVDTHAQYTDLAACLAMCPLYPEGTPGDVSGNSINCRLDFALKAPGEPLTYCTWAGPGGDGKCGSNCEGFCTLMTPTCTKETTLADGDFFASNDACLTTCAGLPDVGNYSATDDKLQSGTDHVECRLYHVGAAIFADDAATHCPHAMGERLCFTPKGK